MSCWCLTVGVSCWSGLLGLLFRRHITLCPHSCKHTKIAGILFSTRNLMMLLLTFGRCGYFDGTPHDRNPLYTPSGCSGNALCARTARFYVYGLGIVEQKCRILKSNYLLLYPTFCFNLELRSILFCGIGNTVVYPFFSSGSCVRWSYDLW